MLYVICFFTKQTIIIKYIQQERSITKKIKKIAKVGNNMRRKAQGKYSIKFP